MRNGEQHIHTRKRIHQFKQKYPHPNKNIRRLDDVAWFAAIILPFTSLPQIYKIFAYQDAAGLSLLTWVLYTLGAVPMLLYGMVHKEKPIMIMNMLCITLNAIIVIGIVLYG